MRQLLLCLVGLGVLVGCGDGGVRATVGGFSLGASAVPAEWAWGERVLIADAGAKSVRVTRAGVSQTFVLNPGQPIFDLPAPPADTDTTPVESSVSPQTYQLRLDSSLYVHRGSLEVLDAGNKVISTRNPFGSVVFGQISFLASRPVQPGCGPFLGSVGNRLSATGISGFNLVSEDSHAVNVGNSFALCYASVNVGRQGTDQALARLETTLGLESNYVPALGGHGYVTDKNTAMNLMQVGGAYAYDPDCGEIQNKLDPISNSGYGLISMNQLTADLNLTGTTLTGNGVNIIVIGSGFGASDSFTCLPGYDYAMHSTHIGSIVRAIAPNVGFQALSACNSSGICKSSDVLKTLMSVAQQNPNQPTLIDMSLGGPLPNKTMYSMLDLLRVRNNVQVIASGGNTRRASAQYPASYSSGVAAPGSLSLSNVISIAAIGLVGGVHQIAGFNTRANADMFAHGVNLCPPSVMGQRCLNLSPPSVKNLGVTGSSYAAPVALGVAALLIQKKGAMPLDLRGCLRNNLKMDSVTTVSYVALMNGTCP